MKRFLLFAALLSSSAVSAATISSATCSSSITTGCYTSYVPSHPAVLYQVDGTWVGMLLFEGSSTGASSYIRLDAYRPTGGEALSAVTENGAWYVPTAGLQYLRIRAEAWTSGTATVTPRATASPIITNNVALSTPDGGLPVTLGAQRVSVEATGPSGAAVAVSGSVELGATTKAALTAPTCTYSAAPDVIALTTTAQNIPATPLTARTQLVVKNLSSNQNAWCCKGSGCTPTSTAAYVILPNGDFQSFPAPPTDIIRCRSAVGAGSVNAQEASCG